MKYVLWAFGMLGWGILLALYALPEGIGTPQGRLPELDLNTYQGRLEKKCNLWILNNLRCLTFTSGKVMSNERQEIYLEGRCVMGDPTGSFEYANYRCNFFGENVTKVTIETVNLIRK